MDVYFSRTLEEALELRAAHPEAVPIAGGTDLMVEMNFGKVRPEAFLDISRLAALQEWRFDDGRVFLGSGVTYTRIMRDLPQLRALGEASRGVGSPQIRNRGTVGGNLGTGSPAGESIPVLAAHDAEIGLVATGGRERWVPWNEYVVGVKKTTLAKDELILGARWRHLDGPQSYSKVGTRNAMVISIAMLCFALDPAERTVRVALGAVAPTAVRASEAETYLAAELERAGGWDELAAPLSPRVADAFAERVEAAARPIDDVRGTAAYRLRAVHVLARRALGWAMEQRADEAMVG
jgi:CO/xanthine dehydrogenase FAD-binding subunit